jgi:multidrug efflux pump subunit AcrA (membrane-fusion protein)
MKALVLTAVAVASLVSLAWLALSGQASSADPPRAPAAAYAPARVAANGVVEGARPEVALRPEVAGVISAIPFRENRRVARGTVLVELRDDTQKHQVALAEAELAVARADLERLRNGERAEKRQALAAVEKARRAAYLQAKADYERAQLAGG